MKITWTVRLQTRGAYGTGKSGKLPDLLLYPGNLDFPQNPGFFRFVSAFRLTQSRIDCVRFCFGIISVTQQAYQKTNNENIILRWERQFSVIEYQPVWKYKIGQYILYRYNVFLFIIYIFNSNIEICITFGTVHDIGAIELFYLFTLLYICPKNIILSIFTPDLAVMSNKESFSFLHLTIVNATRQFLFVKIHSKSCRVLRSNGKS